MLPWEYFACKWKVNKEKIKEKKKWGSKKMFTNPIMLFIYKKIKITIIFLKCSHENTLLVNEKWMKKRKRKEKKKKIRWPNISTRVGGRVRGRESHHGRARDPGACKDRVLLRPVLLPSMDENKGRSGYGSFNDVGRPG
jgi:hypothetical protein